MNGVCSEVILKFLFIWNASGSNWFGCKNLSFLSKHSISQNKIFKSLLTEGEIHGGIFPLNNNLYFSAPVSG